MIRTTRRDRRRCTGATDDSIAQDCLRLILLMGVPIGWRWRDHGVGSCTIYPKYTSNSMSFSTSLVSLPVAARMHSSQRSRNTAGRMRCWLTGQGTQKKHKHVENGVYPEQNPPQQHPSPSPRLGVLPLFARCPPKLRPRTQSRRTVSSRRETKPFFTNAHRRCSTQEMHIEALPPRPPSSPNCRHSESNNRRLGRTQPVNSEAV